MRLTILTTAAILFASPTAAQDLNAFDTGPVFAEFGPHAAAAVEGAKTLAPDTEFNVAFDVVKPAEDSARSRAIESAARFINMHAANDVDPANIRVAIVVHGKASLDLISDEAWAAKGKGDANPSAALIRALLDHGVRVILCGQSGAANGVASAELIPGVETALSAMTAHALLQQRGYTVNPF